MKNLSFKRAKTWKKLINTYICMKIENNNLLVWSKIISSIYLLPSFVFTKPLVNCYSARFSRTWLKQRLLWKKKSKIVLMKNSAMFNLHVTSVFLKFRNNVTYHLAGTVFLVFSLRLFCHLCRSFIHLLLFRFSIRYAFEFVHFRSSQ